MPKLFCSFSVGLKSAFYGTSMEFVLILYFCEPLLIIVQERDLWKILSYNIYLILDQNKRKAVNRMLLRYFWKLFIRIFIKVVAVRHSKWKVFENQKFHLTSTIYLLLRCLTEKQTQLIITTHPISLTFFFKFPFFWFSCFHRFCVLYFV